MAEQMVAQHQPALSSFAPNTKRKRDETDIIGQPSAKREPSALDVVDQTHMPFNLDDMTPTHAAPRVSAGINVSDFDSLQQATAEHSEASNPANASSTAAAALGSMYPSQLPAQVSNGTYHASPSHPPTTHSQEPSYSPEVPQQSNVSTGSVAVIGNGARPTNGMTHSALPPRSDSQPKLSVGTAEWNVQRKHNHKEVERRRRETINEGINELAKIVPSTEKNKGTILANAVSYINELRSTHRGDSEKWNLESLLSKQAIDELQATNTNHKTEIERLHRELDACKRVIQEAGLALPQTDAAPE